MSRINSKYGLCGMRSEHVEPQPHYGPFRAQCGAVRFKAGVTALLRPLGRLLGRPVEVYPPRPPRLGDQLAKRHDFFTAWVDAYGDTPVKTRDLQRLVGCPWPRQTGQIRRNRGRLGFALGQLARSRATVRGYGVDRLRVVKAGDGRWALWNLKVKILAGPSPGAGLCLQSPIAGGHGTVSLD